MSNLHILDITVIGVYLTLCLVIGLYKASTIKTIREYTIGTGYISSTVLFFTIFATHIGAGSTVGMVEKLHSMGLIFAIAVLAEPLIWLVTAKVFARNIDVFKKAGCMSVSDVMGFLYGKPGKWLTNILAIFFSIGVISMQVGAIGYLFNYFLGVSHASGVLIGFGVLVLYSIFGGIRAVALTDTFQGLILLVAIPLACAIAFHDIGGYDSLVSNLPSSHLSIDFTKSNVLLLASMILYFTIPMSPGTFMQRFLMANDSKQLNKTLKMLACTSLPFALIICLIGFVIKVKAPEVDPNLAFFYLIGNYLPIGITGLLISGILAAIMSTADSWLNTTSVVCAHDIAKALFPKLTDKQELLIARVSVLVIATLSVTIALTGAGVMELEWLAGNFWEPVVLIPLVSGFMLFQTTTKSFVCSSILGIIGVLLGGYITGEFATISLLFGIIGSTMGLFGMHYWQVYTGQEVGNNIFTGHIRPLVNSPKSKSIVAYITKLIKKQTSRHKEYCYLFGGLGVVYFLGSSFFMEFTNNTIMHTILCMKVLATILCFGLCVHDYYLTPKQRAKYMPIYWYITLLYCFPFLSSYIALVYASSAPWILNLMLSIILLYVFGGLFTMVFLSVVGFAAAYALFKLTGYNLALVTSDAPKVFPYVYCILTTGVVLILKHKDMAQEKELQSKMLYGTAVGHEVINPLHGASMMADILINAFKDKNRVDEINQDAFDNIKELLEPFKEASDGALKTVDRLLNLVRTDIAEADDMGTYNIGDCVNKTLKSYGLNGNKLNQIQVKEGNEFDFKGSKHFVGHVLNNLISNALKYAGPDSSIEIWYEGNELHFKDNGHGIAPEKLPYIFDILDKNGSTDGTGVGLPFCKRIMEGMGGSIECYSTLGKGTEFVLIFAKDDRKEDLKLNIATP